MKINIPVLIIGAGYSGLIIQNQLFANNHHKSIIIERGYKHGYTGKDYIVFTKDKLPFSSKPINIFTSKIGSGAEEFTSEYTRKIYNKTLDVKLFCDNKNDTNVAKTCGYPIDSNSLLSESQIYGNIIITKIDMENKIAYGNILHIRKEVEIKYDTLINTIPLHEFAKIVGINVFDKFGVFISYFPIGIKKISTEQKYEDMIINYYSDPNIPFYRTQRIGNSIFYEYCLNKPFDEKFDSVIIPGKFSAVSEKKLIDMYSFFSTKNIYLAGRFAAWHPDFLLDHLINFESSKVYAPFIDKMYQEIIG